MSERLRIVIRTPHGVVVDEPGSAVRLPTCTGLVGLRPRGEPLMLVFEAGLVVVRTAAGQRFVATAGGLLEADRRSCTMYTPFAVAGDDEGAVLAALNDALSAPDTELAARRQFGDLERRILHELRQPAGTVPPTRPRHG